MAENNTQPLPGAPSVCGSSETPVIGPQLPPCESRIADQREVELQKAIILQREQEVLALRDGVKDINNILKALAVAVGVRGDEIVTIEGNVDGAVRDIIEALVCPFIYKIRL